MKPDFRPGEPEKLSSLHCKQQHHWRKQYREDGKADQVAHWSQTLSTLDDVDVLCLCWLNEPSTGTRQWPLKSISTFGFGR